MTEYESNIKHSVNQISSLKLLDLFNNQAIWRRTRDPAQIQVDMKISVGVWAYAHFLMPTL